MTTMVLSTAGAAIGGSIGGSVLGMSAASLGKLAGASLGYALDQRLLGAGSDPVQVGQMDRMSLSSSGEGTAVARLHGRMKLGGHVIWATQFDESVSSESTSGKAASSTSTVETYSYSVSLALALCDGQISGVHRVWADGLEIQLDDLSMDIYYGTEDQSPDPKMEAVEGAGAVPAYLGTAYVVISDLDLTPYGNRVPQFSFEVTRPAPEEIGVLPWAIQGVAVIPGTGEYSLATDKVYTRSYVQTGEGDTASLLFNEKAPKYLKNSNSSSGETDFVTSLGQLDADLPNCGAASLVVSWFGDDLRCGHCQIRPKVEVKDYESEEMPWRVCGVDRDSAELIPQIEDRPVYGGTPTDQSVIQAIAHMHGQGLDVLYYPFILMDQLTGNGLTDPWGGAEQAQLPWRGRITTSLAPDQTGTVDGTAAADAEVDAFFGTAQASDFSVSNGQVSYTGPDEWGMRRFILHQAALCQAAGGVHAFCIGSEMRSVTQIRGANGFPAVDHLIGLAAECRTILGADTKIGYAADWSEYFGYQPTDGSGDVYFHLDLLWADDNIDFVGIDNYMPLSDWRDGNTHLDADWGSIYALDYLTSNVAGGEGYDWYYASDEDRSNQIRSLITDGAYNEPWIYRYKDIANWWGNDHYERVGGVRQATPTDWQPQSKPIWFTEIGCAAVDKGTNQPNKFVDPKSSESSLPYFSNGARDELMQQAYLRAMYSYWGDETNNPISDIYAGAMVDMTQAYVWAWDARPYPWFPGLIDLWSDGDNYALGHWLNGRASGVALSEVVSEICINAGVTDYDVSQLHGFVRGYSVAQVTDARSALQPLMLAHGFDAIEREGVLVFRTRGITAATDVAETDFAISPDIDGDWEETRSSDAETVGRVRVGFIEADADYVAATEESILPGDDSPSVAETELNMVLTRGEAVTLAERWLAESRVAKDTVRLALPPSLSELGAGDVLNLQTETASYHVRIDSVETGEAQLIDAVRVESTIYDSVSYELGDTHVTPVVQPQSVVPVFMDLPLIPGALSDIAPHLALTASPWPGQVAAYSAPEDTGYALNSVHTARSVIGMTQNALGVGCAGRFDYGPYLEVTLLSGALESVSETALFAGANLMAIGDGSADNWEIFQFQDATLLENGNWALSTRLRGQMGTDAVQSAEWPAGSMVVLLDGSADQIDLNSAYRALEQHYRVGPASKPYDDALYVYESHAFSGNGLRPYRPCHLAAAEQDGDISFSWVRRTRLNGDDWETYEVPLGEDREAYLVRILKDDATLREVEVTEANWTYSAVDQAEDGADVTFAVAQISDRFGPGPFAELAL